MKTNWQTKKLGDICDFYNGLWKGKEPPYIHVGVIRNTNITKEGKLNDTDIAYLDVERKQFDKRKLAYGDIVLEKSGGGPKQPVGRVIIFDKTDGNFSFSNFTSVIRVKDQGVLDFNFLHKFLFYSYFIGITERMQSHSTGIRNLDLHKYKEIEIPFPQFPEQQRIVKILDDIFINIEEIKRNAEINLQNSKELFESYLQSIFANPGKDWDETKLGDVCGFVRGPFGGSLKKNIFKKDGYVVYEQQHAIYNQFTNVRYFVDEKKFNEMKRFELKSGDLIMSCSGTMGKIAVAPDGIKKGIINQALLKLSPHHIIYNQFLKYWMESGVFQDDLKMYTKGAAIKNVVSVKILKEIKILVPKVSEQKIIVKKLDEFSAETKRLEQIYEQKLSDLDEFKKSVLSKAFHAEL
ncbi:MAG: restriction endonuclease subunit S [Candidatus Gottesmanbacteria bacterium]|nr:restriction endonuclease subunit S [Candidatus Gottesmanbacteria bacterium]